MIINLAAYESILIPSCPFIRVIIPRKNESVHLSFTNRAMPPVSIGVSRGEGCSQNLHPINILSNLFV